MNRKTIFIGAGVLAAALCAGGVTAAIADSGKNDTPISGPARERASGVALAFTHGGRVSATEVNDEESYYQVEVTKSDGSQVDVNLDEKFNVVKSKAEPADSGRK